jgi:hypothetical protein
MYAWIRQITSLAAPRSLRLTADANGVKNARLAATMVERISRRLRKR